MLKTFAASVRARKRIYYRLAQGMAAEDRQARRFKLLEGETIWLSQLIAELSLDKKILSEVLKWQLLSPELTANA